VDEEEEKVVSLVTALFTELASNALHGKLCSSADPSSLERGITTGTLHSARRCGDRPIASKRLQHLARLPQREHALRANGTKASERL
jgi:hypothetical protein